jgi:hypothetical protein
MVRSTLKALGPYTLLPFVAFCGHLAWSVAPPASASTPQETAPEAEVAEPAPEAPKTAARDESTGRAPAVSDPAAEPEEAGEGGDSEEWLMDEETQRRYRIEKLPKIAKAYKWISEDRVRFPGGVDFEVVKHDDNWFWIKYWEPSHPRTRRIVDEKPTPEELSEVAATYPEGVSTVDRIQLVSFDDGLPRAGQWRNRFDVADMDGDGHLDIVFGPSRKGRARPNIFLGDGEGHWRLWSEARYPQLPYDYGAAKAADFDGDGHQDLAFGIHLRGLLAIRSDGEGGFEPWSRGMAVEMPGEGGDATTISSRSIAIVDWNRDGRPDVLALGEGPKGLKTEPGGIGGQLIDTSRGFFVYLNQGDGSWVAERPYDLEAMAGSSAGILDFGDDFAYGDVDGDGLTDLISATNRLGNQQILSLGSRPGLVATTELPGLRPNALVGAVTLADLDGDGADEIVAGYRSHELSVWRTGIDVFVHTADGGWERRPLIAKESRIGISALASGDLDADGKLDVAGLLGDGEIWTFLGDGEGGLALEETPETPAFAPGCRGFDLHLVNLDGEPGDELIASFAGETTGFPGIAGLNKPGCRGGGSILAWKANPRSPEENGEAAP